MLFLQNINPIFLALVLSLIIQICFFIYAAYKKTDLVTDLSYGLSFIIISILFYFISQTKDLIKYFLLLLIVIWGVRLAVYLFIRIKLMKKDKRFDGIRENFWKFAQFWFFQGISIWVILLPVVIILSKNVKMNFNFFSYGALLISILGIFIEAVADYQKFKFKKNKDNKGKWIESGLWKYSRHPNYFGEMLMWWGVFAFGVSYFSNFEYLSIISPIFITVLLLFITGVPTIEKRYDKKYKDNRDYQKYKRTTNKIIPWFK